MAQGLSDFEDTKKLESFLGKVDEIDSLIKNLNSDDESVRAKAIADSDKLVGQLDKKQKRPVDSTGFNRTVINRDAYKEPAQPVQPPRTEQEAFMKALEKDANERAERKKKARAKATVLKDEGNSFFKSQQYTKAVDMYSKGLEEIKDYKELWTNRAQAYIKLEKYAEALSDCDWAQRCDENFVKAYVLEGKTRLLMKDYDKSIEAYQRGLDANLDKESLFKEYIHEVELIRDSVTQDQSARNLFASGSQHASTLVDVLNKVNTRDELPLFYNGGVRVLTDIINDDQCKVLFRTEGGLNLFNTHPFFRRVMLECNFESLNRETLDACSALFCLLQRAVHENEESQRQLIHSDNFSDMIFRHINPKTLRRKTSVKSSCLNLFIDLIQTEIMRKYISQKINTTQLMKYLGELLTYGDSVTLRSMVIISTLASDERYRSIIYKSLPQFIDSIISLLEKESNNDVIPSILSSLTNLCSDDYLRKTLSTNEKLLSTLITYIASFPASLTSSHRAYKTSVHSGLGLLMNITLDKNQIIEQLSVDITKSVLPYINQSADIQERVIGVLSHILSNNQKALQTFTDQIDRISLLVELIKTNSYLRSAVKVLTSCTQSCKEAVQILSADHDALQQLNKGLWSNDEVMIGNIALCLTHCSSSDSLKLVVDKESMKKLLVLVREANLPTVKQNCAILIGRLATKDKKYLEWLRELDGVGILHNSTKYYQL